MPKTDSARTARGSRSLQVWSLRLLLLVIVLGAWTYGTGPGGTSFLILPSITDLLSAFVSILATAILWKAVAVTLLEIVVAFLIAVVAGIGIGFFLSRTPLRGRAAEPLLAWGYMFPFVLLYPLFLLWVGVGIGSKIAYAAVAAFFPIAYNSLRGLRAVEAKYLKVGVAFGASKMDIDRHIKVGAARPMILSGIRIGASVVLIAVVLAELLGSNMGLGYELQKASSTLQIPQEYAIVVLIVIITVAVQSVLERALRSRGS